LPRNKAPIRRTKGPNVQADRKPSRRTLSDPLGPDCVPGRHVKKRTEKGKETAAGSGWSNDEREGRRRDRNTTRSGGGGRDRLSVLEVFDTAPALVRGRKIQKKGTGLKKVKEG